MKRTLSVIPGAPLEARIISVRGQKVILDLDLAELYGVTTKRLNEQVKRNANRFPSDFAFLLTADEKTEVVADCDHLVRLKFSPALPRAFTEHGAIMAATVLNSPRAVQMRPPERRRLQRQVDQYSTDAQLWRKVEPKRRARRKLRPRLSEKRLKELALREFAKARPPVECIGCQIES